MCIKNITIKTSLSVIACFCLYSCTYKKHKGIDPTVPVPTTNSVISYNTDIKPILTTYCYGSGAQTCHVTSSNQGANGDFTSYAGLKSKVTNGTIQSRVFNSGGGMPPSYSSGPKTLTATDLQKFKDWVAQGALNN
jgi:hypothetical protein